MVTLDNNGDLPPPSYEQSVAGGSDEAPPSVSAASTTTPTVPPDAVRAVAPLYARRASSADPSTQKESNSSIKGTYLVKLNENNKRGPDVDLRTSNGGVTATVFFTGTLPRPAEVIAESTNGRVHVSVPTRQTTLEIRTKTTNGRNVLHVPRDYDGLIALRATNGSKGLSAGLKEHAVIVANEEGSDSKTVTYRVKPAALAAHTDSKAADGKQSVAESSAEDAWENAETGPDRAHVSSTNGGVYAYYEGEELEGKKSGEDESRCVVM